MEQLILVAHLLVALAIIGLIMLQQGKGADMGASFGAGASQTLFGSSGSGNVLTKATAYLVAVFFATSFGLAVIANNASNSQSEFEFEVPESAVEELPAEATLDAPADSDLPVLNEDLPEAAAEDSDVPEMGVIVEDVEEDIPQ